MGLSLAVRLGYTGRPSQRRTHSVGPQSIDAHLEEVLNQPVTTSLALSPDRANRKPVLQVFDRAGRTIAFAKIGIGELSGRLVRNEASALVALGHHRFDSVTVAQVLDLTTWRAMPVLVMTTLPTVSLRRVSPAALRRAMAEISTIEAEPAGEAPRLSYIERLNARAEKASAVAGPGFILRWRGLFDAVMEQPASEAIEWGSWHGDWTTWNCVSTGGKVAVWDWERFASGVPIGFDALHHELNRTVGRGRDGFVAATPALVNRAEAILAPWKIPAATARVVALLYVLDIALRYMADDQRASGGGGMVEAWAFPAVHAELNALQTSRRETR